MELPKAYSFLIDWIKLHGLEIVVVLLFTALGIYVSLKISRLLEKAMLRKNVDKAVSSLVKKLLFYTLSLIIVIAALNKIGVNTASILTVVGAMGLAVGLALKDSFSHFASGILIVVFRPFTIGDYIKVEDNHGFVEEIGLFHTTLKTIDNKAIIIPNSSITNTSVINYTKDGKRRVDAVFGIDYGDDIKKAKEIIFSVLNSCEKVLSDPPPEVVVFELGESSVNLQARAWVKTEHYWDVLFYLNEEVKYRFDKNGIKIPFPQMDIHLDRK